MPKQRVAVLGFAVWAAACGGDSTGPGGPAAACAEVSLGTKDGSAAVDAALDARFGVARIR